MNAPAQPMLFKPDSELLPLTSIRPSNTHIQQLRRQHFDAEKLIELAASIQANGLLQPILVRPLHRPAGTVKYEIVAGERRFLAADRAGFAHIPANISDLSDAQVLEAQLIENLQREDLRALEEAEGYRELMDLKHINADEVAALIGKSRSYVYARTKLLDLCPAAREHLGSGKIDASKALLIARIKGEKLQHKALELVMTQATWYSYRRLVEKLRDDFMIPMAGAPWDLSDAAIAAPRGEPLVACLECPHFSGNDPELQRDLGDAHVCTDRACFDLKTKLYWNARRRAAEAAGRTVLTGDAAKAVVPGRHDGYIKNGHLLLDAETDIEFPEPEPEQGSDESDADFEARFNAWHQREMAWKPPTYRQILGDDLPADTVLAEAGKGALVELVPYKAVAKQLKARGAEIPKWMLRDAREEPTERQDPAQAAAERAKEEERDKIELEYRTRLLREIHAKWKPPLKAHDLRHIAEAMLDGADNSDAFDALYPGRPDVEKMKEADLQRFMVIYAINNECDLFYSAARKPAALLDYAQRLRIDPKKIRAEVVRDLKPVSAPAADEPDKKPAAKKRAGKTAK
jgi:ParB/RepB/Spo0J family partition protein